MNKAKEISARWEQIKPQIGELVGICCEVEDHAEVTADAYQRGYEQGRKEAYAEGYKEGMQLSIDDAKLKEAYKRGLNDAWEAARTLWNTPNRKKIFGHTTFSTTLTTLTAQEAIEKIRQYEQEKDRQARIEYNFDEIKDVLETTAKECNVSLDEIAEVLAKMKETDNG